MVNANDPDSNQSIIPVQTSVDLDVDTIRKAMKQIDDGLGLTVEECFAPIHAKLLAMKKAAHDQKDKR